MSVSFRCFALVCLVALLSAMSVSAAQKPNVLFLFTDDQRADTVGALGNSFIQTPHIDRIVKSGFVFRNAYCMGSMSGAVCNPSRHMMLSGMSLFRYDPARKENTFGDVMRKAGYVTYHHSKQGNTAKVYHTAFEYSHYLKDREERTSGHHGKTAADDAIRFLHKHDKSRPFFMYIGFAGPHDPRVAASQWMNLYERDKIPLPKSYEPFHPFDNGEMGVRDERLAPWPRTKDEVRKHLHDYYACISSIDHNIGRIVATLRQEALFDNTIIVFSADHGLAIGSHGLFGKQNLYEHSMKAPLVFSGPGIGHGETEAFAYLFDIFPTVCDLAGVPVPTGLDGRSQASVIAGTATAPREKILLAYKDVQRAIRRGDWKLIRYPKVDVTQLFNLRDDPDELHNLAGDTTHADRVAEMLGLLREEQQRMDDKIPLSVDRPTQAAVDLAFFEKMERPRRRPKKKKN